MHQSITHCGNRAEEEAIQRQMALQLAQMRAASMVAGHAVYELERIHQDVGELYQKTLVTALQTIQQANDQGRLTPLKLAALYHRAEAYRYEMLSIVEETGEHLIN